ncbi:Putative cytochrome P450 [Colletotrichum destructivum]|uniref:Cytochrome P450 n=1 Tax=Colletotrichum destructivum TaxID=34406 RepID=A0AAX4ID17_9PEZI|nr:Putative cytochrome P450 [Colletotrichum destructivum]
MFIKVLNKGINKDLEILLNLDVFNTLHFYKLYKEKDQLVEVVNQAQSARERTTYLTFSYSKHACPGWVFAVNKIKIVVANLLCHYDMKLVEGVNGRY